jgi:hypothetical protein
MTAIHDELTVTITTVQPWGYYVQLADGVQGYLDKAQTPAWKTNEAPPVVGDSFLVAVIDDSRSPWRLSALPADIEIARSRRGERKN